MTNINPFTLCLHCHKLILITQLKTYHGKTVCNNCYMRLLKEEKERRTK